jgi:hypothetical protein
MVLPHYGPMLIRPFRIGDTPAALRDRAQRLREHARDFPQDVIADQLREFASELDAKAKALERPRAMQQSSQ